MRSESEANLVNRGQSGLHRPPSQKIAHFSFLDGLTHMLSSQVCIAGKLKWGDFLKDKVLYNSVLCLFNSCLDCRLDTAQVFLEMPGKTRVRSVVGNDLG